MNRQNWKGRGLLVIAALASLIAFMVLVGRASVDGPLLFTCFTPAADCTGFIVRQINDAKSELLVQAYVFTDADILKAIAKAKERGVFVRTILDKGNETSRYAPRIEGHCVEALIDAGRGIAHNKVIVIDGQHVITGSFNFTESAQKRNTENVMLISNHRAVAQSYAANFGQQALTARPSIFVPCP